MKNIIKYIYAIIISILYVSCNSTECTLSIEQIAQLKQIRFYKYENGNIKVKHEKEGTFFNDKLVGFYEGHVDLGIDFDKNTFNSIVSDNGKTVVINTKIIILNSKNGFITNQRYQEVGSFTNEERAQLDKEANEKILEECKNNNGFEEAKINSEQEMIKILKSMGFENITINFQQF
ncbi:MAG: DUF4230 domain-containing protein [Bacteroidales bacterium]|nr:DUF4230 domain-containing protein [Bacteroidales bacterium]